MISVAILAGTVLALTSAMMGSMHDTSQLVSREMLTDVASDVLTDLRVAAAYQPEVMQALAANPPAPFTVKRGTANGSTATITVSESIKPLTPANGAFTTAYDVAIVATSASGHSETLDQTIIQQAVAPGSTVTSAPLTVDVSGGPSGAPGTTPPGTAATFAPGAAATSAPVIDGGGSTFPVNPVTGGEPTTAAPVQKPEPGTGCIDAGSCYPRSTRGI